MVRGASFFAGAGVAGASGLAGAPGFAAGVRGFVGVLVDAGASDRGMSAVPSRPGCPGYSVLTAWPPNSLRSAARTLPP